MTDQSRTFSGDFKRFFLRGLVVVLPSILTLWIVVKAYQFVDTSVAEPINRGIRVALVNLSGQSETLRGWFDPSDAAILRRIDKRLDSGDVDVPSKTGARIAIDSVMTTTEEGSAPITEEKVERLRVIPNETLRLTLMEEATRARTQLRRENILTWWKARWYMDFIGLLVAIIAVYFAGRLLGGFVGRSVYRRLEKVIIQLPLVKQVYPSVKQVVDFLFGDEQPIKFNRVVVCEYPRRGIWAVGFLTGDSLRSISEKVGDTVTVFIPSSPTPFTGYTITLERSEVREVPISVEEAIRFAVSGGVLVPDHQQSKVLVTEDGLQPIPNAEPIQTTPVPAPRIGPRDSELDSEEQARPTG